MEILEYLHSLHPFSKKDTQVDLPLSRWRDYPALLRECGLLNGVEVGVYRGQFSEVLARNVPGLNLTGIDMWTAYPGYKDFGENDLADAEILAKARAERFGFKLKISDSWDGSYYFEDESLDFVFLDGNHDFQHIANDVVMWSKKVRKGGLVSGHDFFRNRHKGFGVKEVIPAWCENQGIRPLFVLRGDKCPSWMYVKE